TVTALGDEIRTVVELTPSAPVVLPGESVTFDVQVETALPSDIIPGGIVQLFQDDQPIGAVGLNASGRARFEVTTLPLRGSSRFHATYSGAPADNLEASRSDDTRVRV